MFDMQSIETTLRISTLTAGRTCIIEVRCSHFGHENSRTAAICSAEIDRGELMPAIRDITCNGDAPGNWEIICALDTTCPAQHQ